ncbi:MAG: hypothetical protein HY718_14565 [Planctomycetes bacterium]|nr:hypothetical protein [Planctomycetota bacterium]
MPAVKVAQYDGPVASSRYRGTTSGDAIFSRLSQRGAGTWQADIQDQLDETMFGGDAWNDNAGDLLVNYSAHSVNVTRTSATCSVGGAAWHWNMLSYDGKMLFPDAGRTGGSAIIPLLWLSYSANASAGLKSAKGNPILIVEGAKPGIFAERLGSYQADNLARALRFRHGNRSAKAGLTGFNYLAMGNPTWATNPSPVNTGAIPAHLVDRNYESAVNLNAGFLDGHAEQRPFYSLFLADPANWTSAITAPKPIESVWIGIRRTPEALTY